MPFLSLTYILASTFQPLFFRHTAFFLQMGKNVTLLSFHSNTCNFRLVRKKKIVPIKSAFLTDFFKQFGELYLSGKKPALVFGNDDFPALWLVNESELYGRAPKSSTGTWQVSGIQDWAQEIQKTFCGTCQEEDLIRFKAMALDRIFWPQWSGFRLPFLGLPFTWTKLASPNNTLFW